MHLTIKRINQWSQAIIMLGIKTEKNASPMFWKRGIIRKICTSPKTAETRGVMKMVDEYFDEREDKLKVFKDSKEM